MDIADMDLMQKLYFKNFEFSAKSDRLLASPMPLPSISIAIHPLSLRLG
jgi:hypothetical protein